MESQAKHPPPIPRCRGIPRGRFPGGSGENPGPEWAGIGAGYGPRGSDTVAAAQLLGECNTPSTGETPRPRGKHLPPTYPRFPHRTFFAVAPRSGVIGILYQFFFLEERNYRPRDGPSSRFCAHGGLGGMLGETASTPRRGFTLRSPALPVHNLSPATRFCPFCG